MELVLELLLLLFDSSSQGLRKSTVLFHIRPVVCLALLNARPVEFLTPENVGIFGQLICGPLNMLLSLESELLAHFHIAGLDLSWALD